MGIGPNSYSGPRLIQIYVHQPFLFNVATVLNFPILSTLWKQKTFLELCSSFVGFSNWIELSPLNCPLFLLVTLRCQLSGCLSMAGPPILSFQKNFSPQFFLLTFNFMHFWMFHAVLSTQKKISPKNFSSMSCGWSKARHNDTEHSSFQATFALTWAWCRS